MHHLRSSEGQQEIDLVIEVGARRLVAIEIKATATPDPGDAAISAGSVASSGTIV